MEVGAGAGVSWAGAAGAGLGTEAASVGRGERRAGTTVRTPTSSLGRSAAGASAALPGAPLPRTMGAGWTARIPAVGEGAAVGDDVGIASTWTALLAPSDLVGAARGAATVGPARAATVSGWCGPDRLMSARQATTPSNATAGIARADTRARLWAVAQPANAGAQPTNFRAQSANAGAQPTNFRAQPASAGAQPANAGPQPGFVGPSPTSRPPGRSGSERLNHERLGGLDVGGRKPTATAVTLSLVSLAMAVRVSARHHSSRSPSSGLAATTAAASSPSVAPPVTRTSVWPSTRLNGSETSRCTEPSSPIGLGVASEFELVKTPAGSGPSWTASGAGSAIAA